MYPELAPLPKLYNFKDLVHRLEDEKDEKDGKFPLPTIPSNIGVLIGRSSTTVNGLSQGRKEVRVLSSWITVLMNQFDSIKEHGKDHPIYKILSDEAQSRGLTLQEVNFNRGWPKGESE